MFPLEWMRVVVVGDTCWCVEGEEGWRERSCFQSTVEKDNVIVSSITSYQGKIKVKWHYQS